MDPLNSAMLPYLTGKQVSLTSICCFITEKYSKSGCIFHDCFSSAEMGSGEALIPTLTQTVPATLTHTDFFQYKGIPPPPTHTHTHFRPVSVMAIILPSHEKKRKGPYSQSSSSQRPKKAKLKKKNKKKNEPSHLCLLFAMPFQNTDLVSKMLLYKNS